MRRTLVLALMALATATCATGARWERPGRSEAERRRDETQCAARANRDLSVPVQRSVSRSSTRVGRDGIELVTVRDFDSGVFDECMRTRGYERVPGRPPASPRSPASSGRLLERDYDRRWHGAQFLTEVQGGSDVGANACVARPVEGEPGVWRLRP